MRSLRSRVWTIFFILCGLVTKLCHARRPEEIVCQTSPVPAGQIAHVTCTFNQWPTLFDQFDIYIMHKKKTVFSQTCQKSSMALLTSCRPQTLAQGYKSDGVRGNSLSLEVENVRPEVEGEYEIRIFTNSSVMATFTIAVDEIHCITEPVRQGETALVKCVFAKSPCQYSKFDIYITHENNQVFSQSRLSRAGIPKTCPKVELAKGYKSHGVQGNSLLLEVENVRPEVEGLYIIRLFINTFVMDNFTIVAKVTNATTTNIINDTSKGNSSNNNGSSSNNSSSRSSRNNDNDDKSGSNRLEIVIVCVVIFVVLIGVAVGFVVCYKLRPGNWNIRAGVMQVFCRLRTREQRTVQFQHGKTEGNNPDGQESDCFLPGRPQSNNRGGTGKQRGRKSPRPRP